MDSRFLEALSNLETRHKRFSLVGTSNVQASGSLKTGFAVNVARHSRETPEPATGACCAEDGSCSVTTFGDCVGTWLGPDMGCDPNPCVGCPDLVTVTFHDVVFDCGCIDFPDDNAAYKFLSPSGDAQFNENPFCLANAGFEDCCEIGAGFSGCGDLIKLVQQEFYSNVGGGCIGTPDVSYLDNYFSGFFYPVLSFSGGLWTLAAAAELFSDSRWVLFFYGTSANIEGPYTNQLIECDYDLTEWPNPYPCESIVMNAVSAAHGGTATVTVP